MVDLTTLIAEIRARCEAATPGEWDYSDEMIYDQNNGMVVDYIPVTNNALFIAAARTDLPRCLDALEIAVACIKKDADYWDQTVSASESTSTCRPGKSAWHDALAAIEAALRGEQ